MGVWTRSATGKYTLVGTGRTAAIVGQELPAETAFTLQLAPYDLGHNVLVLIASSLDGRSAFEVGVIGANIVIRSVEFGDPATVTVHDTAAHSLAAGVPFSLEVRMVAGVIEARLNGATSAIVSYDNGGAVTPLFVGFKHFGWVSNVNGAEVLRAQVCQLRPERVNRADVLIAVCGGDVFGVIDGDEPFLIKAQVFNATGDVCLVPHEQKMYGFDGAHAKIIDPTLFSVENYIPNAGALPGATGGVDGSCRITIACSYRGRLWFNDLDNPQNLIATAVNDVLDLDTGDNALGHAFGLTAAKIGLIGEPITALFPTTRNTLGIGCNASVWELIGAPETGTPELSQMLKGSGISGKDAVTVITDGLAICHTPNGAFLLPAAGAPTPLSGPVLTDGITIDRDVIDDYAVQVRRDPQRHTVHFFLTLREADGVGEHIAYEERVGGYDPARGGWQPDTMLERLGPTASTPEPYLGQIIIGTRDGYLMRLNDDLNADDGEIVTVRTAVSLIDEPKILRETILSRFVCLPGVGATVKYRVWGANTPEQAYGAASGRTLMQSDVFTNDRTAVDRKSRMPALVVELWSDVDAPFTIEAVDAVTTSGRILTRVFTTISLPTPCEPSVYGVSSSSIFPSFSSGPGFSSAFSTSEGTFPSLSSTPISSTATSFTETIPPGFSSSAIPSSTAPSSTSYIETSFFGSVSGTAPATPPSSSSLTFTNCTLLTGPVGDDLTICVTTGLVTVTGGEFPPGSISSDSAAVPADEGWTDIPLPEGCIAIYCSSSTGNDGNPGTIALPVRTIAEGYSRLRDGFADQLLLKRGDTWNENIYWRKSANNAGFDLMMVFGAYGTGNRPRINLSGDSGINMTSSTTARAGFAIMSIHFEPATPGGTNFAGIQILDKWSYFLIEDCYVKSYPGNIGIQSNSIVDRPHHFKIRRCTVVDSYDTGPGHSQGIFMNYADNWLIEGCTLDNNARNKADEFCHNCYIHESCGFGTFRYNISSRACSHGVQQRPGGTNEINVYLGNPINCYVSRSDVNPTNTTVCRYNVIGDSRDIRPGSDPSPLLRGSGIEISDTEGTLLVHQNLVMHQVNGNDNINGIAITNCQGVTLSQNILYKWQDPDSSNCEGLAFFNKSTTGTPHIVSGNKFSQPVRGRVLKHETTAAWTVGHFTYSGNTYYGADTNIVVDNGTGYTGANWIAHISESGAATTNPATSNWDRTILTYSASIGAGSTLDAFCNSLRTQRRYNWTEAKTARSIVNYFRINVGYAPL